MAERFIQIGISQEVNLKYMLEKIQNPAVSKYILECDVDTVTQTLIKEGLLQEWDFAEVAFVPDASVESKDSPSWAKVYDAYRSIEGEIVATNLVQRLRLIADFDRNN